MEADEELGWVGNAARAARIRRVMAAASLQAGVGRTAQPVPLTPLIGREPEVALRWLLVRPMSGW